MSDTERLQLSEDVRAARKLLMWFGGSILMGLVAGICVGIADHFALKELTAKVALIEARFAKYETDITPKVESMWYFGGYAADPRPIGRGAVPTKPAPIP